MTRIPHAARRGQLLEAARVEFLSSGYAGARVRAVADACGVTEALVYKHFESKQDLFEEAVMAPLHDLLAERIEDIKALPVDPQAGAQFDTVRRFFRTLLGTFCDSLEAIATVLVGDRDHARAFYTKHIRPLIDAGVAASESTMDTWPHRDYDLRTAMNAAMGMAFWCALDRTLGGPGPDLDDAADQLADIFFNGIRAR